MPEEKGLLVRALEVVPPQVLAGDAVLSKAVEDLRDFAGEVEAIDVEAPKAEVQITAWGSLGEGLLARLEKYRKEKKAPHLEAGRKVDEAINPVKAAVEFVVKAAGAKLSAWRQVQRRREEELRKEREKEAQRVRCAAGTHLPPRFLVGAKKNEGACEACLLPLRACSDGAFREIAIREGVETADAFEARVAPAPPGPTLPLFVDAPRPSSAALQGLLAGGAQKLADASPTPLQGSKGGYGSGLIEDVLDFEVVKAWDVPRELCKAPEPVRALVLKRLKELAAFTSLPEQVAGEQVRATPEIPGLRVFWREDIGFRPKR